MPTLKEVYERARFLMDQPENHDRKCHFGLTDVEAKERVKNVKGRTRLIVELDHPDTYSEFAAQFDRYRSICGNVHVAYGIMLDLLKALPDESIKKLSEGSHDAV